MRFKGLDLNLLVALDVLLDEQSVSRAAERLHVSQPAMSAALTRIRGYFSDPILQQHGKRMVPTAHAMRIRPKLKALLRDTDALVLETSRFDPATSERRFKIGVSDFALTVLVRPLARELEHLAPGVSFDCIPPTEGMVAMLDQGGLDLVISPEVLLSPDHPSELLFEEEHVVVGWKGNPVLAGGVISEDDYFAAGHIIVELGNLRPVSFSESHLQKLGRPRRVGMRVTSFLAAPEMVVGTGRLTVVHRRLAQFYSTRLDIQIAALPFQIPTMREMLQYHQAREDDPALRWLIGKLHQHVQTMAV